MNMIQKWLFKKKLSKYSDVAFDVILVAGQSNAEGCGGGNDELRYQPKSEILRLTNQGISLADERREEKGYSFSLSFAEEYLNSGLVNEGRKILIVNAAVGGTGFHNGRWGLNGDLYKNLLEKIAIVRNLNCQNSFKALLWHQGETDAERNVVPEDYEKYLEALILGVRKASEVENLPFIAGNMVKGWMITEPRAYELSDSTKRLMARLNDCSYVETDGLSGNTPPDVIHFSRKSGIELGKRYFKAFSLLTTSRK